MSDDDSSIRNGVDASTSEDAKVARVLDEYLAQLEGGRTADPGRLLAEHPAIASQMRSCLEVMHLAGRVAGCGEAAPDEEDDAPLGPRLADYRIVRQIGRGGMGIVYEAEQRSLRRRVALKVLPLVSALDPKQLRRFHIEAQAAAQMHHTHIVPVYAVGCKGGVHYYAMQYIEGKTLAQLIRELRRLEGREAVEETLTVVLGGDLDLASMLASGQFAPAEKPPAADAPAARPTSSRRPATGAMHSSGSSTRTSAYFRTVANLGIQAAEALEHAHQEGVVHRDIKPANVMVDVKGHPWITDFGLARLQNDSGLTLSGDLIGTIRYMSPEQAIGRRAIVDQRTDIYALGVMLYELVALEPAFDGADRREVLRRIIEEEPRSLRALEPAVPRELETIIQKAMAKEPESRYLMAQELADDLRRFLEYRPIKARRPTLLERASKWSRRHRSLVTMAALLLVLGTAVSTWEAIRAARAECRMVEALADAQDQRREAQRKAAEAAAVADFLVRDLLAQASPRRSQDREVTLLEAMARAEQALDDRFVDEPLIEAAIRHALQEGYLETGPYIGKGEKHARRALALRHEHLGPEHPETLESMLALANWLHSIYKHDEAHELCRQVVEARRRVLGPDHAETISACILLGYIQLARGQLEASRATQASAYDRARRTLGPDHEYTLGAMTGLGVVHMSRRESAKAQALFEAVLAALRRAAKPGPSALQWTSLCLAGSFLAQGKYAEAEALYEEALEIGATSMGLDFDNTRYATRGLIACLARQGKGGAIRAFHERWMRRLEETDAPPGGGAAPGLTGVRLGAAMLDLVQSELSAAPLLVDRDACARALKRVAELAAAGDARVLNITAWFLATAEVPEVRHPSQAVVLARQAAALEPQSAGIRNTLGVACYRSGDWQGAIESLEKAEALAPDKYLAFNGFFLAMARWQLGQQAEARTWNAKAVAWMQKRAPEDRELIRFRAEAASLLGLADLPGDVFARR